MVSSRLSISPRLSSSPASDTSSAPILDRKYTFLTFESLSAFTKAEPVSSKYFFTLSVSDLDGTIKNTDSASLKALRRKTGSVSSPTAGSTPELLRAASLSRLLSMPRTRSPAFSRADIISVPVLLDASETTIIIPPFSDVILLTDKSK